MDFEEARRIKREVMEEGGEAKKALLGRRLWSMESVSLTVFIMRHGDPREWTDMKRHIDAGGGYVG